MIPHIVHCCWFGRGAKSELIQKCMASWREKLPGYTFMEWTEDNFDVNTTLFTRQAYAAKRYAYVSDYARLCALQQYGGVYLDTDEKLLQDISPLLENTTLTAGFETRESVMVGVLAAEAGHPLISQFWMPRKDKAKWAVRNVVARTLGPKAYRRMMKIYETMTGKRGQDA